MKGPKRAGRPTTKPTPGQKSTISVRISPALKRQLDAAAKISDRSQSQEAELRLERSFRDERHLAAALEAAHGMVIAGLVQLIAAAMADTARYAVHAATGGLDDWRWHGIPYAYDQVTKAVQGVMNQYRPDGEIVLPNTEDPELASKLGIACAHLRLTALDGRGGPEFVRWAEPIREQLSPLGDRLKRPTLRLPEGEANFQGPGMDIGKPIRRHHVIPLKEAVPDTNEPPSPAPASNKQKV